MYLVGHKGKTMGAKLIFGTPPREHATSEDALADAMRLAGTNSDKKFYIFRAIAVAEVPLPPPPPVKVTEL